MSDQKFMRIGPWLLAAALALTLAVYWIGLHGPFLFDDVPNFALIQKWLRGEAELQTVLLAGGDAMTSRTLAMATFALNAYWMGYDPFGFKLFNLLLHLVCGVIAYRLWSTLLRRDAALQASAPLAAALIVSVWLLHPFNVSTVLYSVQRMTQLAALCSLLGLWLYVSVRSRQEQRRSAYGWLALFIGIPVLTGLGLLSKQSAAALPALCLVLELAYFRMPRQWPRPLLTFYALYLGLPALVASVGFALQPRWFLRGYEELAFTPVQRLLTEARVLFDYLHMLLAPHTPSMGVYTDDYIASTGLFSPPTTAASIALLLLISIGAWRARKTWPSIFAGWFFFLVAHAIEGTILPIELYYEHRNYLPGFGIFLASAGGVVLVGRLMAKRGVRGGRIGIVTMTALVAMLALQTHGRARVWSDPAVLSDSAQRSHPDSTRAVVSHIGMLATAGDLTRATKELDFAIDRTRSDSTRAHLLMFKIWLDCKTSRKSSHADLVRAVEALPPHIDLTTVQMFRFARTYLEESTCDGITFQQMATGIAEAVDGATAQSDNAWPKYFLRLKSARLFAKANRWDLALEQARKAWRPTTPTPAMSFLVVALISNGEIEEARKVYESAVARARPGSKEDDSAIALMKGMIAEAERKGFRSPQGPSQNAK